MKYNAEDFNFKLNSMKRGKNNSITDVRGVTVGHVTYNKNEIKTGITSIIPHQGNIFKEKLVCASHVINGFGKTIGTIQIDELGTLESPILLTNTLSSAIVADGLIKYMLKENQDIGLSTSTVNTVVAECNDGELNRIRDIFLDEEDVFNAIKNAKSTFEEGAVGAGTGMICYGLKGGIGSSSRVIELDNQIYHLGVLVLTNFGAMQDLKINGVNYGELIKDKIKSYEEKEEKGSIIIILATDAPLSYRQLKRVIKRCSLGIAMTGSYAANGSGEVVIGFSTANKINHYESESTIKLKVLNENKINPFFKASKEACEEAILSSLLNADTTVGRDDLKIFSIREFIEKK